MTKKKKLNESFKRHNIQSDYKQIVVHKDTLNNLREMLLNY